MVESLIVTGAVRHGAECFNFYFPQELDKEFLVVWDGFSNPPWKAFKEADLRDFLCAAPAPRPSRPPPPSVARLQPTHSPPRTTSKAECGPTPHGPIRSPICDSHVRPLPPCRATGWRE